jgi:hypothetical protein
MVIVCPAGLTLQRRDEMRDKFGLDFRIVNPAALKGIRRVPNACTPNCSSSTRCTPARHPAAASTPSTPCVPGIRALTPDCEHRLFLSATPHNGYLESFTALPKLLDDQRFAWGVKPSGDQLAQAWRAGSRPRCPPARTAGPDSRPQPRLP